MHFSNSIQALKEKEAIQEVADGFSDLIEDFKDLLYLGDNYTVSMQNVKDGMKEASAGFEQLKRAYVNNTLPLFLRLFSCFDGIM